MPKIAVLGANGQVGAEVCLLLRQQPGVEVVPICRNRHGSSFLRYHGLACRHGLITDPQQAAGLVGDCDAIANFALGSGRPAEARRQNKLLIENSTQFSLPHAKFIYFSTQSVYGNPLPDAWIRWRGAYGREKIRCERLQRRFAGRYGKSAHILRLGHVGGDLQNISLSIREQIASGPIVFAGEGNQDSNTVHVATIVEAILQIAAQQADPAGTYDLMCRPPWTWKQVYENEARACGLKLTAINGPEPPRAQGVASRIIRGIVGVPKRWIAKLLAQPGIREAVLRSMAHLPVVWNEKLQASYYRRHTASEIAALHRRECTRDSFIWPPQGRHFMSSLSNTADLLAKPEFQLSLKAPQAAFPPDLPQAASGR